MPSHAVHLSLLVPGFTFEPLQVPHLLLLAYVIVFYVPFIASIKSMSILTYIRVMSEYVLVLT